MRMRSPPGGRHADEHGHHGHVVPLRHVPVEVGIGERGEVALQAEAEEESGVRVLPRALRLVVHDPVAAELACEFNFGHVVKVGVRHLGRDRQNASFVFFSRALVVADARGRREAQRGGGAVVEVGTVQEVRGEVREVELDRRRVRRHVPLESERREPQRLRELRRRRREREHATADRQRHRPAAEENQARLKNKGVVYIYIYIYIYG